MGAEMMAEPPALPGGVTGDSRVQEGHAGPGLRQRWRLPRKLKITREGKYFIGITLGVGFAAINTGNNLLYLLLGMLLALIVVSSVMSELSLRELSVVRRLPPRAQVGRPHLVEIEVHNLKGRIPSYAVEIEDLREDQPADKRCFFLKISPGSLQVAAYRRTPAKRGVDRHVGFRVATRFPFGFFEKSRELRCDGELIIYPAVDAVTLPPIGGAGQASGESALSRGRGFDVLTVRPLREGDDVRDIYWRKSAHALVVRERAAETRQEVDFVLDNRRRDEPGWEQRFEIHVRDIASRAVAHLLRGDAVRVRTADGLGVSVDAALGADPLLRFLALVAPAAEAGEGAPGAG